MTFFVECVPWERVGKKQKRRRADAAGRTKDGWVDESKLHVYHSATAIPDTYLLTYLL